MRYALTRGKRPSEKFPISIDFTNDIAKVVGDASNMHEVTAKDSAGQDVSGTFLTGATLVGMVSRVTIQGGNADEVYEVTFKVTTAQAYIYEHSIQVPCKAVA